MKNIRSLKVIGHSKEGKSLLDYRDWYSFDILFEEVDRRKSYSNFIYGKFPLASFKPPDELKKLLNRFILVTYEDRSITCYEYFRKNIHREFVLGVEESKLTRTFISLNDFRLKAGWIFDNIHGKNTKPFYTLHSLVSFADSYQPVISGFQYLNKEVCWKLNVLPCFYFDHCFEKTVREDWSDTFDEVIERKGGAVKIRQIQVNPNLGLQKLFCIRYSELLPNYKKPMVEDAAAQASK